VKALIRRTLNRFGLDLVRTTTLHRDLGDHLQRVLSVKRIDGVIDAGANTGQYGRALREADYDGRIYSFEPVARVFEQLKREAAGDPKWHCFPFALGERSESKTINVYDSHVFSSFLQANDYARGIWKSLEGVHGEQVEVRRLDELLDSLPERELCHRFLLKIDTQGFDLQVFHGAAGILGKVEALQSEIGLLAIYEGAPDGLDVLRDYMSAGFFVSGMYPINREPSLAVIEYDVTLVRRDARPGPRPVL
jgi:FkbM family methyltransferase